MTSPTEVVAEKAMQAFIKATSLRTSVSATVGAIVTAVAIWCGRPSGEMYTWIAFGMLISAWPIGVYFAPEREYERKIIKLRRLHGKKLLTDPQFAQAKNTAFQWLNGTLAGGKSRARQAKPAVASGAKPPAKRR